MQQWTTETARILDKNHVTAKTYDKTVGAAGGFGKYVKSRGGVFARVYGRTGAVKTLADLRERMEYVQGLMSMFGFCYWNNTTWWNSKRPFYTAPVKNKGCRGGSISALCQGEGGRLRITNCNYGVDTALRMLGRYQHNCLDDAWLKEPGARKITLKKKLLPGDIVHFYRKSDGRWHHVCMVHSVQGGKVWLYDFGSRFIKTGNPLHYMTANESTAAGGEYGTDKWKAWHIFDLEEEDPNVKSTTDKAVEMIREIDAFVKAKEKEYGETVTERAGELIRDRAEYIRSAADYVLSGHAGSGEARKVFLGDDYDAVQEKVNWIIKTAEEVITGVYGSGEVRKAALGDDYQVVQNQVNRILKG